MTPLKMILVSGPPSQRPTLFIKMQNQIIDSARNPNLLCQNDWQKFANQNQTLTVSTNSNCYVYIQYYGCILTYLIAKRVRLLCKAFLKVTFIVKVWNCYRLSSNKWTFCNSIMNKSVTVVWRWLTELHFIVWQFFYL